VSALPSGTVTFLFTDIESSTRLWEQHPELMAVALVRHEGLLRSAIEASGGCVFKTGGDSFCAAFTSAGHAVTAAAAAQRSLHAEVWPDGATIRVRMALHTGECQERDGDYFGPEVNRTARLEDIAHGGQVVLSRTTAGVVRDQLPPEMRLVDLGLHRLKDLDRPEEVHQLAIDGVPSQFPPLRSKRTDTPTNLTEPLSSFVGRQPEIAEIATLLKRHRLVTLVGSGGIGKTRLATEVGRSLLGAADDGVWLVELAAVSDPDLVASEVLRDLDIGEQSGKRAVETLVEVLANQGRLIILDNCEQVADGCAAVVTAVMRRCAETKLLLTSREPLRVDGEAIYRVPSLSLPPEHVDDADDLAGSGAVALFVERVSAQASVSQLSDDNAPLVAAVCRRLDGMPLALELATARLRSMSLRQLHDRLEQRFGLLTGGSRVALPRHQTLRALVDWSYDLLPAAEQAMFRRVSVFVDGFDIEAAERVCCLGDMLAPDVADRLASLVDKSLVVAEPYEDAVRYRLQETLRQYGAERLAEAEPGPSGVAEADLVAAAHADHYLAFAEQVGPALEGRFVHQWVRRIDVEELNLRAAIEHSLAGVEGAERVLSQFWTLRHYWHYARQPAQALVLLERAREQAGPGITPESEGRAFYCKSLLLNLVDRRLQLESISKALELARVAGDVTLEADALARNSRSLADNGRGSEALDAGAEALRLARRIGDPVLLGMVLYQYASVLDETDATGAEIIYREALDLVERTGDARTAWHLHNNYACLLIAEGRIGEARRHLEVAVDLNGNELTTRSASAYNNLGWVMLQEGDPSLAASYHRDVLRSSRLNGTVWMIPYAMLGMARCATQLGELERAAVLHGGAAAALAPVAHQWEALEETLRARDLERLGEALGETLETLYERGLAMPQAEMVKLALSRP
jgi:predicted ATPase/Tfp pilus assembly protein PilF